MPVVQMPDGTSVQMPDNPDPQLLQRLQAFRQAQAARTPGASPQAQMPGGVNTTPYQAKPETALDEPLAASGNIVKSVIGTINPLAKLAMDLTGHTSNIFGDYTPKNIQTAAQAGVDTNTGSPVGNFRAAYTPEGESQLPGYQEALTKYLGYSPQMRIGPQSNLPEYLNKETNRWTLARPNAALRALPQAVSGTATAIGGVGGGVVGDLIGGPGGATAGSVGGSAAGGFGGQVINNAIGRAVGALPKDTDLTKGAMGEAIKSAGIDTGTLGVLGLLKYARYVVKGSTKFSPEDAQILLNEQKRMQGLIDKIKQGSGVAFNPDMAQVSASPDSSISGTNAAAKAVAARTLAKNGEESRLRVMQQDQTNMQAMKAYFQNILNNFRLQGANPQNAAKEVATAVSDPFHTAQAAARQAISQLPADAQREQTAHVTRAALEAAKDDYETNVEKPAWKAYQDGQGFDPTTHSSNIQVPWSPEVKNLMKSWTAQEQKALIPMAGKDSAGLHLDTENTPGADLADLDSSIRWLRRASRQGMAGQQGVVLPTAKINALSGALTRMRGDYLDQNYPALSDALRKAEGASSFKAGKFRTGLLDTVLTKASDGQPRLTDLESLDAVLGTPDQAKLKPVVDILKGDPVAKNQLNQYLLAKYREEVTNPDTGVPSYLKHRQFMNKYGAFIQSAFSPDDMADLSQVGGLAKKVIDESRNLRAVMPGRSLVAPDGSLSSLNANQLVTGMFSKSASVEKVQAMINMMKQYKYSSHAFEQWRSAAADYLHSQIIKDGQFDKGALSRLLNSGNGQQTAVLEKIFNTDGALGGTKLIKGLKTLNEASKLTGSATIGGSNPDQSSLLYRAARTYFHAFSEEGRTMNFFRQQRVRENPQVLYDLISDPDKMQYVTKQAQRTMRQITGANVAAGAITGKTSTPMGSSVPQHKQQGQGSNASF